MQVGKCVYKEKNKAAISSYVIADTSGYLHDFTPDELKLNMQNGSLDIVNLKLTKDNRIVACKERAGFVFNKDEVSHNIQQYLAKVSLMGGALQKMNTMRGKKAYLYERKPAQYILYFPDDVFANLDDYLRYYYGVIFVYGGRGLKSTAQMFQGCRSQLDFTFFDTSKVVDMTKMFCDYKLGYLDITPLDTSHVWTMTQMFYCCQAQKLDLSTFNTSTVHFMNSMFNRCWTKQLDLSNFDWTIVEAAESMFAHSTAEYIDLTSLPILTEKTKHLADSMFYQCKHLKKLRINKDDEILFNNAATHMMLNCIERI